MQVVLVYSSYSVIEYANVTLWCVSSPIENIVATVEVQVLIFGDPLQATTESVSQMPCDW